jgi:small subunit ribosomal protein S19e
MITVFDVNPNKLIHAVAKELEKDKKITPPEFTKYVKTGPHAELAPVQKNFWYIRCASILRQAYVRNKISLGGLKVHYGGAQKNVVHVPHHKDAGGAIIRNAFKQLEAAGYLIKEKDGRILSPQGRKFLDGVSSKLK